MFFLIGSRKGIIKNIPNKISAINGIKNNPHSFGLLASFPDWYSDPAKTRARRRTTFTSYNPYFKPTAQPVNSGLVGPVSIRFLGQVSLSATTK